MDRQQSELYIDALRVLVPMLASADARPGPTEYALRQLDRRCALLQMPPARLVRPGAST